MARFGISADHGRPLLTVLLSGVLLVAACGGSASAVPSASPDGGATPTSGSETTAPTAGTDDTPVPGDGTEAFSAASAALDALDSYAFRVEIKTTTTEGGTVAVDDAIYSGVVVNRPTAANSLQVSELDADGNVTSGTEYIVIGDDAWIRDIGSEDWQAMPAAQIGGFLGAFRPEQMFGTYFAGIAGNFAPTGSETKNGVATTHYQGDANVGALLGSLAGVAGDWHSDVWIANDGGFLVHSEAGVAAAVGTDGGGFLLVVDITDPNSAGPIDPPS